jgi:hypothetical protein
MALSDLKIWLGGRYRHVRCAVRGFSTRPSTPGSRRVIVLYVAMPSARPWWQQLGGVPSLLERRRRALYGTDWDALSVEGHAGLDARLGLVEHRDLVEATLRRNGKRSGPSRLRCVESRAAGELASPTRGTRRAFLSIAASLSVPGGLVIVFRDPDNVRLELFASPEQAAP